MSLQFASFLFGLVFIFLSKPFGIIYSIGIGLLINTLILYSIMILHDYRMRQLMRKRNHRDMNAPQRNNQTEKAVKIDENGKQVNEELSEEENLKIMKSLIIRKYIQHVEEFNLTITVSKEYYSNENIKANIALVEKSFNTLKENTGNLLECIGQNYEDEISTETIQKQMKENKNENEIK